MLSLRQERLKSWSRSSNHHPRLGLPPSDERTRLFLRLIFLHKYSYTLVYQLCALMMQALMMQAAALFYLLLVSYSVCTRPN